MVVVLYLFQGMRAKRWYTKCIVTLCQLKHPTNPPEYSQLEACPDGTIYKPYYLVKSLYNKDERAKFRSIS